MEEATRPLYIPEGLLTDSSNKSGRSPDKFCVLTKIKEMRSLTGTRREERVRAERFLQNRKYELH